MQPSRLWPLWAALGISLHSALAAEAETRVTMYEREAATFYVPTYINGVGHAELMVDTGSGYVTINEQTLHALKQKGSARYVKHIQGVLANGHEMTVPIFAIDALNIGGRCWLYDVEAAVFPGNMRQILGLSALRKAAPFTFSVEPPALTLSHCTVSANNQDPPSETTASIVD